MRARPQVIVYVHGLQASGRIWQLVCDELPGDQYRVVVVDNRGAGRSDAPAEEAAYGVKPFADDLYGLVTALDLRDIILVGHSMGGATAMQFAVDHPESVRALALVDPAGPDGVDSGVTDVYAAVEKRIGRRGARRTLGTASDARPTWRRRNGLSGCFDVSSSGRFPNA
jgi:pimeloyl-ACP methyl ester carboxylesterase